MRVIVSASSEDCVAHWALTAEGVPHDVVGFELGYPEQLAAWWRQGEGFVLVEQDVAPWPGAVQRLIDCPREWCAYRFPKYGHLVRSLGCVKFSTRLLTAWPALPEAWEGLPFAEFEGPMLSAIADTLRVHSVRKPVCEHAPPVAHAYRG